MFGLSSKYTVSDAYLLHAHKIPRRGMGIILRKHFLQVNRTPCSCPWLLLQFKYSEIRRITLSHFFNYLHSPPQQNASSTGTSTKKSESISQLCNHGPLPHGRWSFRSKEGSKFISLKFQVSALLTPFWNAKPISSPPPHPPIWQT